MASYPAQAIDVSKTSIRFKEPFLSQALNRKMAGYPLGIYRGFLPVVTGIDTLELQPDATFNDSIGVAEDSGFSLHARETATITLDFTGQSIGDFPILVVLEVGYTAPPSGATSADIKTIAPGAFVASKQIKVCLVSRAASISVDATVPTNRQEPFAFTGQTAGFMPGTGFPEGGAIEQLQRDALTTAEVTTARTNTNSATTYPDLQTRMDTEFSGSGIAGLLPLVGKQIRGQLYPDFIPLVPGWSGTGTTANVSADFASQAGLPGTDVPPSTSDTVAGVAISSPGNWVDAYTLANDELIDDEGNRIHGRLSFNPSDGGTTFNLTDDGDTVAGAFLFTEFSNIVQGTGSDVANEVDPGDIVEAPDGTFLAVASADGGLQQLTLIVPYSSTTGRITAPERRRFQLEFNRIIVVGNLAVENPVSVPLLPAVTITFRAGYHRRFALNEVPANSEEAELQRSQAAGRSPDATTLIAGKVTLAANLATTVGTVPTATDGRLLGGSVAKDPAVVVNADRGPIRVVEGLNITITHAFTAGEHVLVFNASGGGGGVSLDTTTIPKVAVDPGSANPTGSLFAAPADHTHPMPSPMQVDKTDYALSVRTTITATYAFRNDPKFAIWLHDQEGFATAVGFSVGVGQSAHVGSATGWASGKIGLVNWGVTVFNSTTLTITGTSHNMSGSLLVIGD